MSSDICKICFEEATDDDPLLSVCPCKGSVRWTHDECLRRWYSLGNYECCTCRTLITVEAGSDAEYVPWRYDLMFNRTFLQTCVEVLCNLYAYLLLIAIFKPDTNYYDYFYMHASWQAIYYCAYLAFLWWRYIRLVKKKELYRSMIWPDVREFAWIQLGCVCGLWFIHQPIYHISSVLLSRYIHHGILYTHYTTVAEMNQLVPFVFKTNGYVRRRPE
jgi:hypothetical protein